LKQKIISFTLLLLVVTLVNTISVRRGVNAKQKNVSANAHAAVEAINEMENQDDNSEETDNNTPKYTIENTFKRVGDPVYVQGF